MWEDSLPWWLKCTRSGSRPIEFEARGRLVTRRWIADSGERGSDPWVFQLDGIWVPAVAGAPNSGVFKALGIGAAYKALAKWIADELHRMNPQRFAAPTGMPSPGAKGHPELFYATWVRWYLDALDAHGQRYMKALRDEKHLRDKYSPSAIRRIIARAEQLGLIDRRPGAGKAGGFPTPKCEALLKNASPSETAKVRQLLGIED